MATYKVTDNKSGEVRLIEARLPAQARAHVTKDAYTVEVANARMVGELFGSGKVKQVEQAKAEDAPQQGELPA